VAFYTDRIAELNWWQIHHIDAISANGLLKTLSPMVSSEVQLQELLHTLVEEQQHQLIAAGGLERIWAVAALRPCKQGAQCSLFSVRPDLRRQGIGRFLLDCLCQRVAAAGGCQLCIDLVGMESDELQSMLPFLRRTGFVAEPHNKMRWVKADL